MTPDFLEVGRKDEWMEGGRRTKQPRPRGEQNTQLERRSTVKRSLLANERAISPHIKVLANEGLFIIGKRKSWHNPISCPLIQHGGRRKRKAHLD